MAKKVEEVVLTKADFEQAVKDLGEFLGEEITIEGERDECVEEFLNAVGGIPPENEKNIPGSVLDMNNALVDKGADVLVWEEVAETQEEEQVEKQEEEKPEPEPEKKVERRGRPKGTIKKEVEKEEKTMKEKPKVEKKTVVPEKKVVAPEKKIVEKEVKKALVKKEKVTKAPKAKAEVGRYGHRKDSAANFMDELLWKGCTQEEAITAIVKSLGKTKERAKGMFLAHVYYLPDKKNIPIDKPKVEGGKYKAKKAETDI